MAGAPSSENGAQRASSPCRKEQQPYVHAAPSVRGEQTGGHREQPEVRGEQHAPDERLAVQATVGEDGGRDRRVPELSPTHGDEDPEDDERGSDESAQPPAGGQFRD